MRDEDVQGWSQEVEPYVPEDGRISKCEILVWLALAGVVVLISWLILYRRPL